MKNSRKLFEYLYEFVNTLGDNDLKKVCSGEYRITLDKETSKNPKHTKKIKSVQKKSISIDVNKIEDLHKKILCCKSRAEAKKVFDESKFKKDELLSMGEYLKIKIPKSYNKPKIIDILVETLVGGKIDDECIL